MSKSLTREEALALLRPQRSYTETEHEIAWRRYCANSLFDELYQIHFDIDQQIITTVEQVRARLREVLYPPSRQSDPDIEFSEGDDRWFSDHDLKKPEVARRTFREEAESGEHVGDCTSFPATCSRCWTDEFYQVRTDVDWPVSGWELRRIAYPKEESND